MKIASFNINGIKARLPLLREWLEKEKPDIVQTWMYHADLFGGIACRLAGIKQVFWNVRNTQIPQKGLSVTLSVIKICAFLSKFIPKKVICCAQSALESHVNLGYRKEKMVVVPNGFETTNKVLSIKQVNDLKKKFNVCLSLS